MKSQPMSDFFTVAGRVLQLLVVLALFLGLVMWLRVDPHLGPFNTILKLEGIAIALFLVAGWLAGGYLRYRGSTLRTPVLSESPRLR